MVEHALGEGSARGGGSKGLGEAEGLSDWEMRFHGYEWSSWNWLFSDNDTSSLGKAMVDWTNTVIWGLDLAQEDWFLEGWARDKLASVEDSSGSWDDLSSSSVNSISV